MLSFVLTVTPPSHTHQKPRSRTAARTHSFTYTERQVDEARTHTPWRQAQQRCPVAEKRGMLYGPTSDTVQVTIKRNVLYGDGETRQKTVVEQQLPHAAASNCRERTPRTSKGTFSSTKTRLKPFEFSSD
ncbi:Hypothetical predicted protein [Xyrichtys novacula]|uniref:Uncharacterized protein n=1 Tax=Xyrichtys novacula TaxID=13765 RepID=A0AAV1FBW4_XYRNO|nr:Hypothetical predicted protein [Xyrichtys novacula]